MLYHIRITQKSNRRFDETKVDLTEEQLINGYVTPYTSGLPIVINGKVIQVGDIERIRISRSEEDSNFLTNSLREEDRRSSVSVIGGPSYEWRAAKIAEDVTDRYINTPPGREQVRTESASSSSQSHDRVTWFNRHPWISSFFCSALSSYCVMELGHLFSYTKNILTKLAVFFWGGDSSFDMAIFILELTISVIIGFLSSYILHLV